jgi:tRNA(Ile)-lysidine synthase TilS/MesJ
LNQVYAFDENYSLSLCPYWLSAEKEARNWRHSMLQRTAHFYKFSSIYFGHTETDRLETLLFQLLRGSGIQGVHSIQWKREIKFFSFFLSKFSFFTLKKDKSYLLENIILKRPLMGITRLETCFVCNGWRIPSYSDNSNASLCYTRNKIRIEVLPILRRILNPRLEKTISRFAEIVSEEECYLNNILDNIKTWVGPSTDLLFISQAQMEDITVTSSMLLEGVSHDKKIEHRKVDLEPFKLYIIFLFLKKRKIIIRVELFISISEKKWFQSMKPLFLKPNIELFTINNRSNSIISFSKTYVLRQAPLALKRRFLKMKLEDFQVKEVNFQKVETFKNAFFNKSKKKNINTDLNVGKNCRLAFSAFYKFKNRKNIFISILFIPKVGVFFI